MQRNELNDLRHIAHDLIMRLADPSISITNATVDQFISTIEALSDTLLTVVEINGQADILSNNDIAMLSYIRYYIIPYLDMDKGRPMKLAVYDSIILKRIIDIRNEELRIPANIGSCQCNDEQKNLDADYSDKTNNAYED